MSLLNSSLNLRINVRAYVGSENDYKWIPATFCKKEKDPSSGNMTVISIDVDETNPWHIYNGRQFLVPIKYLYYREEK